MEITKTNRDRLLLGCVLCLAAAIALLGVLNYIQEDPEPILFTIEEAPEPVIIVHEKESSCIGNTYFNEELVRCYVNPYWHVCCAYYGF